METIKFKTALLGFYSIISSPGRYELQVANNVSEENLIGAEGENKRYIVNLKAVAHDKVEQLKQVFAGKDEVAIEDTNGLFMTANLWKQEGKSTSLPMKGEIVDVTIDYVKSREGQDVLRVTNIQRQAAKTASRLDVARFFELAPATPATVGEETLQTA